MKSIWQETTKAPLFDALKKNIDVDIAVIGGGIAGILCAYLLKQRGFHAAVFEANRICSGQIAGTTAKITIQHGPIYADMIKNYGFIKTRQYLEAGKTALALYQQIINDKNIDCDFHHVQACLMTNENTWILEREYEAYRQLGIEGNLSEQTELPFPIKQALYLHHQAIFHPLKFLYALSKELTIYEHTQITEVDHHTLKTSKGYEIKAHKVIFACHYPMINFPGYYFLKMYQSRSHVACFQTNHPIENAYLSIDQDKLSFRPYENNILIGGFPHRTGQTKTPDPFESIEHFAGLFEKQPLRKVSQWASQDCMSLDGFPYVGRYASKRPDWYVITGFNKWGMTNAMAGAKIISDLMIYQESEYEDVFAPDRFEPSTMSSPFLKQTVASINGFTRYLKPSHLTLDTLHPGEGGIIQHGLKKTGVYKDLQGNCHYCSLICPHLGCELQWNPVEKTWDCPCHGSRFDIDGHLLSNPALHHLKKVS